MQPVRESVWKSQQSTVAEDTHNFADLADAFHEAILHADDFTPITSLELIHIV